MDDKITDSQIHLWIQQRGGQKKLTTVVGLMESMEVLSKMAKSLSKRLSCSVVVKVDDTTQSPILRSTGDFRKKIKKFLIDEYKYNTDQIIVHGG